jgi:hypothetical protein
MVQTDHLPAQRQKARQTAARILGCGADLRGPACACPRFICRGAQCRASVAACKGTVAMHARVDIITSSLVVWCVPLVRFVLPVLREAALVAARLVTWHIRVQLF